MVHLQYEIEMNTKAGLRAQQRWKHAYIAISISNKLLAALKKKKSDHLLMIIPEATTNHDHGFSSIIDKAKLRGLVKSKDLGLLGDFNGVKGLAEAFQTNLEDGISSQDAERRKNVFGSNTYNKKSLSLPRAFSYFLVEAFKDTSKLLQLVFTAISLGFMIKQERSKQMWNDGGSIFVDVLIIALSALAKFIQARQFHQLSKKINKIIRIDVLRDRGRRRKISIFDVVVGDVVVLNIGDRIPADGLFIDGHDHSLLVDESSMMSTGKSDRFVEIDAVTNPFLISGSKVIHGNYARMLVISVMTTTSHDSDDQQTTLQSLLNKLTCSISKVACLVSFIDLLGILIRYFSGNTKDFDQNGIDIIPFVISNMMAIAEGLSLAFTVGLMYSTKGMMDDQAIVKKASACEAMGTATVICTHKTGTLTMNQMEVTKFRLGIDHEIEDDSTTVVVAGEKVLHLFHQGVGLNTTGSVYKSSELTGSPTEKAILSWGVMNLRMEMEKLKNDYAILHAETFSSEKMRSGVLVRKKEDDTVHVHWKGAAETVLTMCSNYYQNTGHKMSLNHDERTHLEKVIEEMEASGFRCIAFAHKPIPAEELKHNKDGKALDQEGLTLLGIVGIKDPCRPGVKEAIDTCRDAGVHVMMITGANLSTAKAIATECGILEVGSEVSNNGEEVIEGKEFRNYTEEERMDVCDKILVMARSTPSDKLLLVQCLKKKGHVVAVTGHRAHDAPAMKEADIGLSMGIEGTEVAKESSDIVIVDDDFGSVVKGLSWGRCVFHNIQKFIQFQLPPNLAALAVNFISDASGKGSPLITSVQMLWVNLVMVTFGALALATDQKPTKEVMKKPPVIGAHALRITSVVWRNLLAQSLYQIIVILLIIFFNVNERVRNTMFFNTFVFCQLFNLFNSRKVEKMNVFEGVHKNKTFLGIVGLVIVLQVMIMVVFLNIFVEDMEKLNMKQWGICIAFASLSWPIGWFVKMIPVASSYLRSRVVDLLQATTKQEAPEQFGHDHRKSSSSELSSLDNKRSMCSQIIKIQETHLEVDKLKMCNDAREVEQERKRREKGKGVVRYDDVNVDIEDDR
ncbi:hypothetical protein L6452_43177 [Arctium lappa]|uniref:Uncharacterized protein n=1 Tax=Arctium lappa TaxID=4217 RepID=A0ACB8XLH6_ARCLA|nr:hypothetical protein L6452_43177 [Arctium lappa]